MTGRHNVLHQTARPGRPRAVLLSHGPVIALLAVLLVSATVGCRSVGSTDEFDFYPIFASRIDNPPDIEAVAMAEPFLPPDQRRLRETDVIDHALRRTALSGGMRGLGQGVDPVAGYSTARNGAAPEAAMTSPSAAWPLDRYVQARDSKATTRFDALAPLFEYELRHSDNREEFGFHPLFYVLNDPANKRTEINVLWPLGQYVNEPNYEQLRVLPLFFYEKNTRTNGSTDMDMFIFPLIFYGEDIHPGAGPGGTDKREDYFAFVPFGGTLRNFLLNDWLEFFLFPLFLHTRQETMQGTFESWYLPWPLIHWGHGAGRESWHFLPFYGQDVRRELVDTEEPLLDENGNVVIDEFGRPVMRKVPGRVMHERYDVLWPLIHYQRNYTIRDVSPDPTRPDYRHELAQESLLVFPFYGHTQTATARTTSVLWPLFNVEERPQQGFIGVDAPFPIFRYAQGIGHYEFRLWPLFWEYKNIEADGTEKYNLKVLWPIIWYDHDYNLEREWTSIKVLPFFWRDEKNYLQPIDGGPVGKEIYTKVWPIFGMHEERDGTKRIEILSPLPFDDVPGFENNWAMFWRLFYWEENGDDTIERMRLLGPLIRYERTPTRESFDFNPLFSWRRGISGEDDPVMEEEFNILYGLFGWGRDREGPYARLFWFFKIR